MVGLAIYSEIHCYVKEGSIAPRRLVVDIYKCHLHPILPGKKKASSYLPNLILYTNNWSIILVIYKATLAGAIFTSSKKHENTHTHS